MRILVIFTFDISLKKWQELGILNRELLPYKKLAERGYKIGLLTYGDKSDLELKNYAGSVDICPVYSYFKRPRSRFKRFLLSFFIPLKLAGVFKDYDIYKTNQMLGAWVAVIAKLLYGKKLLLRCGYEWLRNTFREAPITKKIWIAPFGYMAELLSYAASEKIAVTSDATSAFIKKAFKPFLWKVTYAPNYVDTNRFRKLDAEERYTDRALYIGRLNKVKNLASLFEAVELVKGRIGLDVIGGGEEETGLRRLMEKKRLNVRLLGVIPNERLPEYINRYPVFTIVSYFENNPKTLLEAMACERVVVASSADGIKELVKDGINGILTQTDPEGIAKALEKAFSLSGGEKTRLGKNARETVLSSSSLEKALEKEAHIYDEMKI